MSKNKTRRRCCRGRRPSRSAPKPRRNLWEQFRDRLLRERGHCLDLLADLMDETGAADGYNDPHLYLAIALFSFLRLPREQRKHVFAAHARWAADANRIVDDGGLTPHPDSTARPDDAPAATSDRTYGLKPFTVQIDDATYTVERSAAPLAADADAHISHCERTIWLSPTLGEPRAPRIVARAVAQAWKERIDGPDLSTEDDATHDANDTEQCVGDAVKKVGRDRPDERDREALPVGELDALAGDLLAVQWKLYDTGWPMPPNLPADAVIDPPPSVAGAPPLVFAGPKSCDSVCPHCGKVFRVGGWWARHLQREHGWRMERGSLLPPPLPGPADQQRRAA